MAFPVFVAFSVSLTISSILPQYKANIINRINSSVIGIALDFPPEQINFVDKDGRVLGRHKGITHYTVGQRKGLNLALGRPVFVTEIRPDTNEVVIGDNEDVFSRRLTCGKLNWMAVEGLPDDGMKVTAKIRYSHKGAPCMIDLDICSATDCTGLIPALPQSDGEITSYEQLYHFLPRAKNESEKD